MLVREIFQDEMFIQGFVVSNSEACFLTPRTDKLFQNYFFSIIKEFKLHAKEFH